MLGADAGPMEEFGRAYADLFVASSRAAGAFFRYDPGRVEDVVAEALTRTFERWERVRRHDNPIGWVVVCTKNVCLEELRRDTRDRRPLSAGGVEVIAVDVAERSATEAAINDALMRLSKRQRDVAVLRYLMDLDEATTATALAMTVSKVKTAANEARTRLRGLLSDEYFGESSVSV